MKNNGVFALYPFVPVAVSFVSGLVAGDISFPFVALSVWIAAACLSFLLCLLSVRHPVAQSLFIVLLFFMFGGVCMMIAKQKPRVSLSDEKSVYESVVASEPVERGKTLRFEAIITSGRLTGKKIVISLMKDTVERRYSALSVNVGFVFASRLKLPANYSGSRFDYAAYLERNGVDATAFVYYRDWCPAPVDMGGLSVFQRARLAFLKYRHSLISAYRELGLDGQTFAVAAAMTLGHKSELSADIRDAYSVTGVSHVLALSGMHLGIIYMLLTLLSLRRGPSLLREILIITAVWSYVFMVGMPVSVVRAATMITVYSIVGLSGRERMSVNVLAFTAMLMLTVNPLIIYDVGFQLSFVSLAGILVLCPFASRFVSSEFRMSHPVATGVWQIVVVSFVAQLATAPLVAFYFGRLPLVSLFANIIAVPALTLILYLSVVMIFSFFIPSVSGLFAFLLSIVVSSLNHVLVFLSSLPFASVEGISLTVPQVCAVYVFIISLLAVIKILLKKSFTDRLF
ncbi:MAG: ComEC/Rec2 family competence protein [Prevotella sp.]|nr:ComEC/Rec2 family competence protein [Prevotella sp.]